MPALAEHNSLGHLLDTLPEPVPARASPQGRDGFLRWLAGAEQKQVMRLGWALGLSRDIGELADLWEPDGSHAARLARLVPADLDGIPASLRHAKELGASRSNRSPFVPLSTVPSPAGALLVHFTWQPESLFRDGFLGTTDLDGLANSFRRRKTETGYNFAVAAHGFDAQNLGEDDFYGDDAVLFRAPHLATYNVDSDDEEVIFRGDDVAPGDMIHLSRSDEPGEGWAVIGVGGETLHRGGTVNVCVAWVVAHEDTLRDAIRGPRDYAMRASDDHIQDDGACPSP